MTNPGFCVIVDIYKKDISCPERKKIMRTVNFVSYYLHSEKLKALELKKQGYIVMHSCGIKRKTV